jgi:glycerophosphoryl diester phosphodiesterase
MIKRCGVALLLVVGLPLSTPAWAVGEGSAAAVAACIRDARCQRTFVAAHRARGFGAPDNSRAAVAAAVKAGVPVIEVDVRRSRDGDLFVFHDASLDRESTGRGRLDELTAEEVSRARLPNGETVPRLAEIYAIARGRAVLALDAKDGPVAIEQVARWLEVNGSMDDALLFLATPEKVATAARLKQRTPTLLLMVRLLDTRMTPEVARSLLGAMPEVFHTEGPDVAQVARVRALGVKVWVNVVDLEWPPWPWRTVTRGRVLQAAPDFVLTDKAPALMQRLGQSPR